MSHLRALLRLGLTVIVVLAFYLLLVVGRPLSRLFESTPTAWRDLMFRTCSSTLCKIMSVTVETVGRPPEKPFLLVSNHLGYLDIIVLAGAVDAVFISKAEVESWPVIGPICRAYETIFLDRSQRRDLPRAAAEISRALDSGRGVVLFAEGTSSGGVEVLPFRPSLLEVAVRTGRGVAWSALTYATPAGQPAAGQAVCWWGDAPFAGHIYRLLGISRICAKIVFGDTRIQASERKSLAAQLHARVSEDFIPVDSQETPCNPRS